jgi:hypothetical protein
MLKTKRINDVKISKIRLPRVAQKKIRGACVLPLYSNTFLCAKKNSGKTTTIYNALKKCVDKDTIIDLFVSTIEKDRSWIQIVKHFRDKGCTVNAHTSTIDDDGVDLIRQIIDTPVEFSDDEESESESEEDLKYISVGGEDIKEPKEPKRRKPAKLAQKRVIVLDDIGNELSKPSVSQLLKINRHLRCKVILSTQYLNDLSPMARRQIDVWLLFGGLKKGKLEQIIRDCDTRLDYNDFEHVYKFCTDMKYNFMYLDCASDSYRKNFNEQISIT